jgi:hypothetical protein
MQCTWAEVAEEIGLSESMIYQVKSGARRLSPKAEHRLAIVERKEGLAPGLEQSVHSAISPDSAFSTFATGSAAEQIAVLKSEPGLRAFWFELQMSAHEAAIKKEIEQASKLAKLVKSAAKSPGDKKLQSELLDLARNVLRDGKNLDIAVNEMFEAIREFASRNNLSP